MLILKGVFLLLFSQSNDKITISNPKGDRIMYQGHIYNIEGKSLSGIKVSDGKNICITDNNGFYILPGWERARVISVGILTTAHSDWFKKIEVGKYIYDFHITPYEGLVSSSFLHISDTEIYIDGAKHEDWFEFLSNCVEKTKPDFIIHTGDICRKRGLEEHYKILNSERMGIPVRYTLGNHDYVADDYGEQIFETLYGPLWYSFDIGNIHYVILPITDGEAPSGYKKTDRAEWLREDLSLMKPGQRLAVFSHTHGD